MATSDDLRRLALAFPGVAEKPHFDRRAFYLARTFVTLAGDGETANIKFTPEEQAFKAELYPDAIVALDNGWGRQGWTMLVLDKLSEDELRACLDMAFAHAQPTPKKKKTR